MYGPKGYGFFSRFGQKWVTILATLVSNKAWFCSLVYNPTISTKALHNASNIGLKKEQTVSRIELKALFHDKEDDSNTSDKDTFETLQTRKPKWTPLEGQFVSLDFFINNFF